MVRKQDPRGTGTGKGIAPAPPPFMVEGDRSKPFPDRLTSMVERLRGQGYAATRDAIASIYTSPYTLPDTDDGQTRVTVFDAYRKSTGRETALAKQVCTAVSGDTPPLQILDLATGTGFVSAALITKLARKGVAATIHVNDSSEAFMSVARQRITHTLERIKAEIPGAAIMVEYHNFVPTDAPSDLKGKLHLVMWDGDDVHLACDRTLVFRTAYRLLDGGGRFAIIGSNPFVVATEAFVSAQANLFLSKIQRPVDMGSGLTSWVIKEWNAAARADSGEMVVIQPRIEKCEVQIMDTTQPGTFMMKTIYFTKS